MLHELTPRFNYTLPPSEYLKIYKILQSPDIKEHEKLFGESGFFFFRNARAGLRLLLSSTSMKNLRVGVQAFTCHTVFQAIQKAGGRIKFIDLNNELKLDRAHLKTLFDGIDVLILTHTFGYPEDVDSVRQVLGNKIIIEDCSHSFLSRYKDNLTGTLGDAAIFSCGLGKYPPVGSGGFCVVNTADKFQRFENLYNNTANSNNIFSIKDFIKILALSFIMKPPFYGMFTFPIGKKLDKRMDFVNKFSFSEAKGHPWSQRLFKKNLQLFDKIRLKQTSNAQLLFSLLKHKNSAFISDYTNTPNFYVFPLLIENRDELYKSLLQAGVEVGKHFSNSIEWALNFGYEKGACPNTEDIIKKIITVPVHPGISRQKIEKISKIINSSR